MKLQKDEKILKVVKYSNMLYKLLFVFIIVFLFFIAILGWYFRDFIEYIFLGGAFLLVLFFYHRYLFIALGVFVFTNKRIIFVKHENIFRSEYTDISYDDIKGMKARTKGMFQNYFDIGEIIIQTEKDICLIKYCDDPKTQASDVLELIKKSKE